VLNNIKNVRKNRNGVQVSFYDVTATAVLIYGSEEWVLNRSDRMNIETAEMRFIRSVHVCSDHVRNTTICNALQICVCSRGKNPTLRKHKRI
jgi:hypothetical protein